MLPRDFGIHPPPGEGSEGGLPKDHLFSGFFFATFPKRFWTIQTPYFLKGRDTQTSKTVVPGLWRANTHKQLQSKGLAAQSKAKAIGQNQISSVNQRPGFQMICFLFGQVWCYWRELCFCGSKVRVVAGDSVHEHGMNLLISPFLLEKRLNVSE